MEDTILPEPLVLRIQTPKAASGPPTT